MLDGVEVFGHVLDMIAAVLSDARLGSVTAQREQHPPEAHRPGRDVAGANGRHHRQFEAPSTGEELKRLRAALKNLS